MSTPTIPNGKQYMDVLLWSGAGGSAGATRVLTGLNFQPDFTWEKDRASTQDHHLFDSVRGAGLNKTLASNSTGAEGGFNDTLYGYLSSFNSNGVTTTNGSSSWDNWNKSGDTYVAWNWKANGTAVSNTAGTITSQVSANTTSGFSVVTYTGTGSAGVRVGHGLGAVPSMIIAKQRGSAGTNWAVYHTSLPSAFNVAGTQVIYLNDAAANTQNFDVWDSNNPSSSVFSVGASTLTNASGGTYVAYCWAPIAGYSAFGSYTGNGSTDGPFVYLGFRPKFLMLREVTSGSNWFMYDTTRNPYNTFGEYLLANSSTLEGTRVEGDLLSNGFKLRTTSSGTNPSGGTVIYAAFAENPFKYANAR